MLRHLSLTCGLAFAFAIVLATPAHAQQAAGGYCGEVTWQGQAPAEVWVSFRRNGTWVTSEDGAMSAMGEGTYAQTGSVVSMTGGQSPQYQVTASVTGDRIIGEVVATGGTRGVITLTQMRGTGSGLRSSPVPANFVPEAAERALAGDMSGLLEAFSWSWTPQGVDYWRPIYQSGQLPDHAVDALRDWVRRARAGERPVCDAQ